MPTIRLPFVLLAVALAAPAEALHAQSDTTFHVSLRGWAEEAWVTIMDRRGAGGGRISERGALQRFDERIDDKYHLDRLTNEFWLTDEYEWYASDNGARWQGGSISKAELVTDAEFKVRVPIDDHWAVGVRFNQITNPEGTRSPVRLLLSRKVSPALSLFAAGHIDPDKPGSDVELGLDWRLPRGGLASVALVALDAPNDLIYLNFDAVNQAAKDSTLEYERQPLGIRAAAELPLSARVRLEAYGAYIRPSTILQYDDRIETAGLWQRERFSYVGGLVEWAASPGARLGGFANTVVAATDREPLSGGAGVDAFALRERTSQVGAFYVARLSRRWTFDSWLRHTWRPERRDWGDPALEDVDYLLRTFNAQAVLTYRAPGGFLVDGGLVWHRARVPRGDGQVPATGNLVGGQYRVRYDFGWHKGRRFRLLLGSAFDIDERTVVSFGGARARVMLLW